MAEDLIQQMWKDIGDCEGFLLQLDESRDVSDITAQEELSTVIPLKEHRPGDKIFQSFKNFIEKTQLLMYKLVSITMDGAPTTVGHVNGFIAKCRQNDAFPNFLNYHCII